MLSSCCKKRTRDMCSPLWWVQELCFWFIQEEKLFILMHSSVLFSARTTSHPLFHCRSWLSVRWRTRIGPCSSSVPPQTNLRCTKSTRPQKKTATRGSHTSVRPWRGLCLTVITFVSVFTSVCIFFKCSSSVSVHQLSTYRREIV